ncbi:hypothetical protein [Carnobacterium jeotgali]|nr:hypothetical protein [Carnobacterium jeotgali]
MEHLFHSKIKKSCLIQIVIMYQLAGLNQPNQWLIEENKTTIE